jgi:hypothetical protein
MIARMKIARVHLPSEIEIKIEPGPDGSVHGSATLRAHEWIAVPQSMLDLKITPTRGDVHFDPASGAFTIEITLAALIQKPKQPPDPPLIIMP